MVKRLLGKHGALVPHPQRSRNNQLVKSYQVIYENMKSRALSSQSQDGQPSFLLQAVVSGAFLQCALYACGV